MVLILMKQILATLASFHMYMMALWQFILTQSLKLPTQPRTLRIYYLIRRSMTKIDEQQGHFCHLLGMQWRAFLALQGLSMWEGLKHIWNQLLWTTLYWKMNSKDTQAICGLFLGRKQYCSVFLFFKKLVKTCGKNTSNIRKKMRIWNEVSWLVPHQQGGR